MILLDTHIWMWWVNQSGDLLPEEDALLHRSKAAGLGAMLSSKSPLTLAKPIRDWMHDALHSPGVYLIPLSPRVSIDLTLLAEQFHGDPADRIIVATANSKNLKLVTRDQKILANPNVSLAL